MSLKITLADIAAELHTTAATVSRALNDDPSISASMKQKISAAASRLNYRPHKIAASLRKGQSGLIGVIIPSAEINFFGSVVHGIETLASENGYNVLIYQTNELTASEIKGIETFLSARVDGILVSISKQTKQFEHFLMAQKTGTPIVFFDRAKDHLGIHAVVINDFKGGYLATKHLLEQGYKRIAHISGPQHLKIFNDRFKGYKRALREAGIALDESLIFEGDVSIDSGKAAMHHFLQLPDPPDAVFAVEDFTALGVIKALKNAAIKIPKDFGVVGFANEAFGEHITPTLTTIDQQTVLMGKNAFELLHGLMLNKDISIKEQKLVLEPLLIQRQSSTKKK
jgi:LacI family transcriptional regulator